MRGRELEEERAPKGRSERARVRHRTLRLLADVQRSRASPGRRSEEAWSCPGGRSHKRLDLVDREAERQTEYALGFFDGQVELYQVYNLVAVERRLDMLESLKGQGVGAPEVRPLRAQGELCRPGDQQA